MLDRIIISEVDLAMRGYTLSVEKAASLGRVGSEYVMRDADGHRESMPISVDIDQLTLSWAAFRGNALQKVALPPQNRAGTIARSPPQLRPARVPKDTAGWLQRFIAGGREHERRTGRSA